MKKMKEGLIMKKIISFVLGLPIKGAALWNVHCAVEIWSPAIFFRAEGCGWHGILRGNTHRIRIIWKAHLSTAYICRACGKGVFDIPPLEEARELVWCRDTILTPCTSVPEVNIMKCPFCGRIMEPGNIFGRDGVRITWYPEGKMQPHIYTLKNSLKRGGVPLS